MNLKNAALGEQYNLFIDAHNIIINNVSPFLLAATVLATKKPEFQHGIVILGWKENQKIPYGAIPRLNISPENDYVSNEKEFKYALAVSLNLIVAGKITAHDIFDGQACCKCKNYFKYAAPNQADNTFMCWQCRNIR